MSVTDISYHARNNGPKTLVGTATFNVQPDKIGGYFDKIQCFCFTKQVLKPGKSVSCRCSSMSIRRSPTTIKPTMYKT